ncbi:MAG: UDP-N-acetylmuramoyl-L-alanine--D-glutamate ligase [Bacteroidota bacterium]
MKENVRGKIVVMGAGESGIGAAVLAKKKGWEVWVSDASEIKPKYLQELAVNNIPFEAGRHTEKKFFEADCIVKSPGIPGEIALLTEAKKLGVELISEIEFGYRYCSAPVIAVTGSNGKTTTTQLIYHLLIHGGYNACMAGNVGDSFAKAVLEKAPEVFVLEVSSFQLDDIHTFNPHIGILLNISPDHLDRYQYNFDLYAEAKWKLTQNMGKADTLVYNADDLFLTKKLGTVSLPFQKLAFGEEKRGRDAWIEGSALVGTAFQIDFSSLQLLGIHNQLNCLAAILTTIRWGMNPKDIEMSLQDFKPVVHRLETLESYKGIAFINDSKATNVESVKYALQAMEKPIVWIVGGVDKGNDYQILQDLVRDKVKSMVILGSGEEKLKEAFPFLSAHPSQSMQQAIEQALTIAQHGDVILLSPACASFDLFENYEDRGNQFKKAVRDLVRKI